VFRLTNFSQADPSVDASCSTEPGIVRFHSGYQLQVSGLSQFHELTFDPLEGQAEKVFWIALSGYFLQEDPEDGSHAASTGKHNAHARHLAFLLGQSGDISRVSRLRGNYCILLSAPWRRWCAIIRDEVGGRTAFHASRHDVLAISDRPSEIARLPEFGFSEDPNFISSLFAFRLGRPLGVSAFEHVQEVLPGERVEFHGLNRQRTRPHFQFEHRPFKCTVSSWTQRLEQNLEQSTRAALQGSSGPAIMLSGGMDSSPVAAIADRILKQTGKRLNALSWRLGEHEQSDEAQFIDKTVAFLEIDQYTFDGSSLLPYQSLDASEAQLDAPYLNPFWTLIKPIYRYAETNGNDVILHGGAGDVLYPHQSWVGADMLRRLEFVALARFMTREISIHGLRNLFSIPSVRFIARMLIRGLGPISPPAPEWMPEEGASRLPQQVILPDAHSHWCPMYASRLIGNLMSVGCGYENMVTEEYGISRRDPFADRGVARTFLEMPFSLSHREGKTKWITRELARSKKLLPREIYENTRTGILNQFLAAGFYSNLAQIRQLLMDCPDWRPWLDEDVVLRSFEKERASAFDRALTGIAIGYVLWKQRIRTIPAGHQ